MYKIKIKTTHNVIELLVEDYFSEEVQEIINQPYFIIKLLGSDKE